MAFAKSQPLRAGHPMDRDWLAASFICILGGHRSRGKRNNGGTLERMPVALLVPRTRRRRRRRRLRRRRKRRRRRRRRRGKCETWRHDGLCKRRRWLKRRWRERRKQHEPTEIPTAVTFTWEEENIKRKKREKKKKKKKEKNHYRT